ncbi:DUF2267 domain-containing protein [Micromonospora sp. LAH09]|uniref:DUF2267 domain-containing protein n=1 Tax=Micromonospora cabrerizensis TaxID=2911213 RepID=UPI001EE8E781|nr:DUF2267 domain-containing protein [Micromonospora cabrerizensis]MCG5469349.1 DUF2267 domain-containing protein [Micromonospora cabrerizensis]
MTDGDGFPYFIDAVSRRSGLPAEQAAALAQAVLQTMAERVTGGAPDDLVGHLPDDVDGYLAGPGPDVDGLDAGLGLDAAAVPPPTDAGPAEFLSRVGQRAGVDPATARAGTGAVFATLREAMTVREFREMVARLPRDDGPAPPGR